MPGLWEGNPFERWRDRQREEYPQQRLEGKFLEGEGEAEQAPLPVLTPDYEIPNALGELGNLPDLLTLTQEQVTHDEKFQLNHRWRLERRNDRNPPGFAIFQRGKPVYIGYIGYYSRSQKPEGFPTYSQLTGRS